jgi:hypothetical protein
MGAHQFRTFALAALACCALTGIVSPASAQDIEPRAYSNAPVGVNFLVAGYAYTTGGLAFDSALPLSDPDLSTSNAVVAYARVLDFRGKSAKFDVIAPLSSLSGSADFDGETLRRDIAGLADPKFRLSVNFFGAPALSLQEFAGFKQDLIIGASLQVSPPVGQYDASRLVNLGTNRWSFKPELGVSKALGRLTLEGAAAVTLYLDNDDFYQGRSRSQDPLYSLQGHLIYSFRSGVWGSLDGTYFTGGRTTLDGELNDDLQQNWRVGATLAFPVNVRNSIKLYGSSGVSARTGNDFDLLGIAWQYRWGGGL